MPPPRQIQKVAFSSCTRIDSGCVPRINQFETRIFRSEFETISSGQSAHSGPAVEIHQQQVEELQPGSGNPTEHQTQKIPKPKLRDFICGGKGTRTPNPLLAKQMRYQLRHTPKR